MATELEQEFYDTFGIEEQCICPYSPEYMEGGCEICIKYFQGKKDCNEGKNRYKYPDITAEKLLEMICIYNEFQNNCDNFFIPTSINNLKENFLAVIIQVIKDETANRYFCNNVGKLKYQIQQLFKEA